MLLAPRLVALMAPTALVFMCVTPLGMVMVMMTVATTSSFPLVRALGGSVTAALLLLASCLAVGVAVTVPITAAADMAVTMMELLVMLMAIMIVTMVVVVASSTMMAVVAAAVIVAVAAAPSWSV